MPPLTYTGLDVITDALIEIGIIAPGDTPDGETGQWAFRKLNDLLDVWAARKVYVWSTIFTQYTLTPNHSPHTIGPNAADFNVAQRPVRVESCAVRLNMSGSFVDSPRLNIRDSEWWAGNSVKEITSSICTDLYYDAAWENGNLFFWPIVNQSLPILLETWQAISQLNAINDPIGGPSGPGTLPPAYRAAIKYTLAMMCCPGGGKDVSPALAEQARQANKAVFGNNSTPPRINTQDAGMPKGGARKPIFNWVSGQPW